MATIDATFGGATSNSYVTLLEAEEYFGARLFSDNWNNASEANKIAALIQATKRIDREKFYGDRVSSTQKLAFPRSGISYIDNVLYDGIIPEQIKDATCEVAIYMLSNDISQKDTNIGDKKSVAVGSIKVEYAQQDRVVVQSTNTLSDYVLTLLEDFSYTASSAGVGFISR